MKLKNIIQLSMPTKSQVIKGIEIVVLAFIVTFVTTWSQQPDPFSKAAILAACAAAITAIYVLLKDFLTTL